MELGGTNRGKTQVPSPVRLGSRLDLLEDRVKISVYYA